MPQDGSVVLAAESSVKRFYAVAESRRVVNPEEAGVVGVDEVKMGYPVIAVELFIHMGVVRAEQCVAVSCEPGVLNIRVVLYEVCCLADEPGIREEELVKIAVAAVESHTDVVGDILLLKSVNGQRKNCQQQRLSRQRVVQGWAI